MHCVKYQAHPIYRFFSQVSGDGQLNFSVANLCTLKPCYVGRRWDWLKKFEIFNIREITG